MTRNQCDGCARGLPVEGGLHRGPGGFWAGDLQACTADRYEGDEPYYDYASQVVRRRLVDMADAALLDLARATSELEITDDDRARAHVWIELQLRPKCIEKWEHTLECEGLARHFAEQRVRAGAAVRALLERYKKETDR